MNGNHGPGPGVRSQQVLCTSARTWAKVIGWIQIVGYSIALAIYLFLFIAGLVSIDSFKAELIREGYDVDTFFGVFIALSIVGLVIYSVGLAAGIVLIKGVKEENPSKLKCWLIIEGIFFAFTILRFILQIVNRSYGGVTVDVIGVIINIFFIWVVLLHRKELLNAGRT